MSTECALDRRRLWWFPQGQPFDPDQYHQGKVLADSLRRDGAEVVELARGEVITVDKLAGVDVVIKVPGYFPYTVSESLAYQKSVTAGTRLLLVGGGNGKDDAVAEIFGLRFEMLARFGSVQKWTSHPFTANVEGCDLVWSPVVTAPKEAVFLAWLNKSEANPRPILGYLPFGEGFLVFVGQTMLSPCRDGSFSTDLIMSLGRYSLEDLKRMKSSEVILTKESKGAAPLLIEPESNATFPQPESGDWRFDWEDVPDAVEYEIVILGPFASFPLVQARINKSEYTVGSRSGSYIAGHNLTGWSWRVRTRHENGIWGPWSRVRRFNIRTRSY